MNSAPMRSAPHSLVRYLSSATHAKTARTPRLCVVSKWLSSRGLASTTPSSTSTTNAVPLRKHLKEDARRKKSETRSSGKNNGRPARDPRDEKWELTVGIEIHAELNTSHKLFSSAPTIDHAAESETGSTAPPNSKVAPFDAALPGSQPHFQAATLLPALRAALALNCEIQRKSAWDRKHYFHWDQPNGYQITQYYQPFALNGFIDLSAADGVPANELNENGVLRIGIKQVQMEQDTAKTISHGNGMHHIDLNRTGHPLIEIITLPQIHSPQTAAALVRKIAGVLRSVDACVTGMELGGLRADVNVSIREHEGSVSGPGAGAVYGGISGLGQRTEIKNLSSFKAVEDAIVAERNRQICVLESGGVIAGETRGWSLGATETTRLRGKEGEVDYRYMPDPDLAPLIISPALVEHLRKMMNELPDATAQRIEAAYGLSAKDAKTLTSLDDGDRLEYLEATVSYLTETLPSIPPPQAGRTAANWILHELGGLLGTEEGNDGLSWPALESALPPSELAVLVAELLQKQITARSAKQVVAAILSSTEGEEDSTRTLTVASLIESNNLRLRPLSEEEYRELARGIIEANPEMVAAVRDKGQKGKVMWFVGQMVRNGEEGTVEPERAREVVERMLLSGNE